MPDYLFYLYCADGVRGFAGFPASASNTYDFLTKTNPRFDLPLPYGSYGTALHEGGRTAQNCAILRASVIAIFNKLMA